MKKIIQSSVLAAAIVSCGSTGAMATDIALFDWAFNIDGSITAAPGMYDQSGMLGGSLDSSGLGTLTFSFTTAGNHSFGAFFDHEIDEAINTYYNEYGSATGTPAAGQTWEIDEPGYLFGDIYDNFLSGTLDNTNGVPGTAPDDVSMAMGWSFILDPGDTASITLTLSDIMPQSGFYLTQYDPDSDAAIYFSGNLRTSAGVVPEPTTMLLMGAGLAGLFGVHRRRK